MGAWVFLCTMGKEEKENTKKLVLYCLTLKVSLGWKGIGSLQNARLPLIRHGCGRQLGAKLARSHGAARLGSLRFLSSSDFVNKEGSTDVMLCPYQTSP
jgi:hypothetical protein